MDAMRHGETHMVQFAAARELLDRGHTALARRVATLVLSHKRVQARVLLG